MTSTDEHLSINDFCARLPKRRWSHAAQGLLLEFPRTGLVGVPYLAHGNGAWAVVVVGADRTGTYQPGGYDLYVSQGEIETAIERSLGKPINTEARKSEPGDGPFARLAGRTRPETPVGPVTA